MESKAGIGTPTAKRKTIFAHRNAGVPRVIKFIKNLIEFATIRLNVYARED
jgi:hypothetical protein